MSPGRGRRSVRRLDDDETRRHGEGRGRPQAARRPLRAEPPRGR